MTYAELKAALEKLNPEQLQATVTVYVGGDVEETFPCSEFVLNEDQDGLDTLDPGHPVISTVPLTNLWK
jgi:hypothetical protein